MTLHNCFKPMKTKLKPIAVFFALFFVSATSFAWNGRGHMIVASIAYRNLSDSLQIHYTDILKEHPFYQDWNKEFNELTGVEFGEFLFMKAATWPDDIRKSGNPNDHPEWHYMSYKIVYDGKTPKREATDTVNVLTQLEYCLDLVMNEDEETNERAIALAWFIHLVGDIHQPLHTASLFNTLYPKGDLGGNSINVIVKAGNNATNLHSFWDGLMGTGKSYTAICDQSRNLTSTHTEPSLPMADSLSFTLWSYESYALAATVAHKNGDIDRLSGIKSKDTAPLIPNAEQYVKTAKATGELRVALGGYRLAKTLSD